MISLEIWRCLIVAVEIIHLLIFQFSISFCVETTCLFKLHVAIEFRTRFRKCGPSALDHGVVKAILDILVLHLILEDCHTLAMTESVPQYKSINFSPWGQILSENKDHLHPTHPHRVMTWISILRLRVEHSIIGVTLCFCGSSLGIHTQWYENIVSSIVKFNRKLTLP